LLSIEGPTLATGVLESNLEEIQQALNLGEDVNSKLKDGSNVLQLAVWSAKSLESIKPILDILVERGIDVDNTNQMGHTALHAAAVGEKIDFIEYLIAKGANVNAVDSDETTPIMLAAWKGNLEVVRFLVEKGKADVNLKNKIGLGIVDYAQKHTQVRDYLVTVVRDAKKAVEDMRRTSTLTNNGPTLNSEGKGKLGQFGKLMKKLSKGDIREWNVDETQFWLNTIGLVDGSVELDSIKSIFKGNKIDGSKLAKLTPEAFRTLLEVACGLYVNLLSQGSEWGNSRLDIHAERKVCTKATVPKGIFFKP
jgi:predicted nucleic-acid-binding protein